MDPEGNARQPEEDEQDRIADGDRCGEQRGAEGNKEGQRLPPRSAGVCRWPCW